MNYYERTVALALTVVAMLIGLHFLPTLTVGGHALRSVNMLADILPQDSFPTMDWESKVLLAETDLSRPAQRDSLSPTLPPEIQEATRGIADYSPEGNMARFYRRLQEGGLVRIAYFGDSFVEGDILTAPLREMLQEAYGGGGVGFVDIATGMESFRQSVRHRNGGFSIHSVNDRRFARHMEGLNQRYFMPTPGRNFVSLAPRKGGRQATESSIYFLSPDSITLTARAGETKQTFRFGGSQALQRATLNAPLGQVEWMVERDTSSTPCYFYGATLDPAQGVVLDNYSMRSSSGATLRHLPKSRMHEFARMRPYDLVVLHFGLNVANEHTARNRYARYREQMAHSIALLREVYPQAAVLIVSCSDRNTRTANGDMETLPGLRTLVAAQHQMARDNGTAFWNLFQAMGGPGSMHKMAEAIPAEANKDYTHLTHRGGRRLARIFFNALQESIRNTLTPKQ